MADWCRIRLGKRILLTMTAWIVLFALTVLFALALRHAQPKEPSLPPDRDGERQLAELRAMALAGANTRFP